MRHTWIATLALALHLPINSFAQQPPIHSFETAEHITAGSQVQLYVSPRQPEPLNTPITLPNHLALTYGEMMSLADFYGIVGQPISQGDSEAAQRKRFITAFNLFADASAAVSEVPQILAVAQAEQQALIDGMQRGEKPEDIYAKIRTQNDRAWNCITGGGCAESSWWLQPGRYLQLANQDIDHFGEQAWLVYQTGHQLALEAAVTAAATHDLSKLHFAYALNAFASHFLSDRFSAGHMRIPRRELTAEVSPSIVGSLLANFMHTEENNAGLHVANLRGNLWFTYGDSYYFSEHSETTRALMKEALQLSADQVFFAYQRAALPKGIDPIKRLIPIPNEMAPIVVRDISPLFYWDTHTRQLYRRVDLSNIYDYHWTTDWWGWSTLVALSHLHGLPTVAQAILVFAGYGKEAQQQGLLTDPVLLTITNKGK